MTMIDFAEFEREWDKAERDRHRQVLYQLKKEFAIARRESDRPHRPVARQTRG